MTLRLLPAAVDHGRGLHAYILACFYTSGVGGPLYKDILLAPKSIVPGLFMPLFLLRLSKSSETKARSRKKVN